MTDLQSAALATWLRSPTDQESAIGPRRLSFPGGRSRKIGLLGISGNHCQTSRILVTEADAVNHLRILL